MIEIISDLRQRHLEAFEDALGEGGIANLAKVRGATGNGMICRAALDAGWIKDVDVGELHGGDAQKLATAVFDAYRAATAIDPN
jgi:hypothetical protein